MFGYVAANWEELTQPQKDRYGAVYCGICRCIGKHSSAKARLTLQYDMAFLALLLMSLYEPQEASYPNACLLHPIKKRPWADNIYVRYAADMNVALAYYKCLDDWQDEGKSRAKHMAKALKPHWRRISQVYPRQCRAIEECIRELSRLEQENCPNPDLPANSFGRLMGQLMVYREDLWQEDLFLLGHNLGRFIYLLDAALDFSKDLKNGGYNPYIAMGMTQADWPRWEKYLVMAMARCTQSYERLPLEQDKDILDNILYSGVWVNHGTKGQKETETGNDR